MPGSPAAVAASIAAEFLERHGDAAARGVPPDKLKGYLQLRPFGHYIPPASGIGIMMDDPKTPYFNNAMGRSLGEPLKTSVRVASTS